MQISEHFSLEEFTESPKATVLGLDNTPNDVQIDSICALCDNILEPIRNHFNKPIQIRSGFRSKELNKAVGGAPTSQHTQGEAADIEIPGVRNDLIWQFIVDNLDFDQVIAEQLRLNDGSAGWVHVSHRRFGNQRNEDLSFLGNGKYVKGLAYV